MAGYKDIGVADLEQMLRNGGVRLLDVRTDAEIAQGKIPEGEPLPLHMVPLHMGAMNKEDTIVFYCRSGGRSGQAAAFFAANGFRDVYNLQGGIIAWVNAGMPVTR